MDIAYESLVIKRKVLEELTERGLYPYSKFYCVIFMIVSVNTGKTISAPLV